MSRRRDRRQARREQANDKAQGGGSEPTYKDGVSELEDVAAVNLNHGQSKPGDVALFAIPFRLQRGESEKEADMAIARFAQAVVELTDDLRFGGIEVIEGDYDAAIQALQTGIKGQVLMAEHRAAQKARDN